MKNFLLLIFLINAQFALRASSIFVPDSDTALLAELVFTTVEQLHELERLITESEKLTGKIQKYNEIAIDHWYRAQRVAYLVEDIRGLGNSKVKNLGELNNLIRIIKDQIREFKDVMHE